MGAGTDQVRLHAAVGRGSAARKGCNVVGAVGFGITFTAAVQTAERLHVLAGADRDDVLGGTRGTDGAGAGAGVSGGEHDDHLLITADSRLRVANETVVGLRLRRVGVA